MKTIKHALFSFLFFISATVATAQWIQKTSLPGAARASCATFAIGTKIYLCGGIDVNGNTIFDEVWEYDVVANTWMQKASFGGGFRKGMVAFVIGNKAYAGMGTDNNSFFKDLWEYDPLADSWTQKANLPASEREEAAAFSIGNKGYIGTGQTVVVTGTGSFNTSFQDFYEYNPATDSWTQKANFPGGVRTYAAGCSIGNKGYMGFGGNISQTASYNDLYEYDPSNNTWATKNALSAGLFPTRFVCGRYGSVFDGRHQLFDL